MDEANNTRHRIAHPGGFATGARERSANEMNKRSRITRIGVSLALIAVTGLWLKELTERRARRAADEFMGQCLTRVGWFHESFIPAIWHDGDGRRYGPVWAVSYTTYFALGEPLSLYVDLLGRVRSANSTEVIGWIGLGEEERCKKQAEMVNADIAFWAKVDQERQQRKAEQSAALLPRTPQAGRSEGAH